MILLSVPDLPTLARMYLNDTLSEVEHTTILKMIYGAQQDIFDYHKIGFDFALLKEFLESNGFCGVERVGRFNLPMIDTSSLEYAGYFISLNIAARPCQSGDVFDPLVSHLADAYISSYS